jgi:hypothetical protein
MTGDSELLPHFRLKATVGDQSLTTEKNPKNVTLQKVYEKCIPPPLTQLASSRPDFPIVRN